MKRFSALCLALLLLLAGCGAPKADEKTEIVVFAAASLTETLTEIANRYAAIAPDVAIVFNFDSSGTLKTQIQEGAECDLFLSAGQKQMDALEDGFLRAGSRIDLLENRVVLCVPAGNPQDIQSFDDLAARLKDGDLLFAMGNADVPVGQYTEQILAHYGLDTAVLAASGCITYGSNAKEVTTQIGAASADCGAVYATDAASAGLDIIDTAAPEMCGRVIYPAAVLQTAVHAEAAQAFLDYLSSPEAMAVFASVGFSAVE